MSKPSDVFKVTFLGQFVEIILKVNPEDKGQMVMKGYLLDIDDDYYYIGGNPIEVEASVKKDLVALITMSTDRSPEEEMLENFEPETNDDGH